MNRSRKLGAHRPQSICDGERRIARLPCWRMVDQRPKIAFVASHIVEINLKKTVDARISSTASSALAQDDANRTCRTLRQHARQGRPACRPIAGAKFDPTPLEIASTTTKGSRAHVIGCHAACLWTIRQS